MAHREPEHIVCQTGEVVAVIAQLAVEVDARTAACVVHAGFGKIGFQKMKSFHLTVKLFHSIYINITKHR